jgi:superoxide dismutase
MDSYNSDNLDLVKLAAGKDLGTLISNKNLEKIITKIYLNMQVQVESIVANDEEEDMKK